MALRDRRRADPAIPRVHDIELPELTDVAADELDAYGSWDAARIHDVELAARDLTGITFTESSLVGWNAHETSLRDAHLTDVRIERWNAPVLLARRARLDGVHITATRIGSAELYDTAVDRLVVEGSKLDWVNLRGSKLTDVVFRDCRFDEIDLAGAALSRVRFENCAARSLVLTGTRSAHLDLRGLEFDAVESVEGMRGAIVSAAQATRMSGVFAAHLGIAVVESGE